VGSNPSLECDYLPREVTVTDFILRTHPISTKGPT
jgi:hypothetical protein